MAKLLSDAGVQMVNGEGSKAATATSGQAIVQADPAVLTVTGFTGEGQRNAARMFITLKPRDQRDVSAEQVVARLRKLGTFELGGTTAALDSFIKDERAKWGRVVQAAKIERE